MAGRRKTPEERKAEAQRKLEKAEAATKKAKAELAAIDAKEKKQQLKDIQHTKFILGGAILAMEKDGAAENTARQIRAQLEPFVTKKADREFLGLPPCPTPQKAGNENLKDQFPEASNG